MKAVFVSMMIAMSVTTAVAAPQCQQVLDEKFRVDLVGTRTLNMDLMVGNQIVIKTKPVGKEAKVVKGIVLHTERYKDHSLFVTYVDPKGQRRLFEYYPELQKDLEKFVSAIFTNSFHFETKKADLQKAGYHFYDKSAYVMMPDQIPQKDLVLFTQRLGKAELQVLKGELVHRPDAVEFLASEVGQKPLVLQLRQEDGVVVDVVYTDIMQLFVK